MEIINYSFVGRAVGTCKAHCHPSILLIMPRNPWLASLISMRRVPVSSINLSSFISKLFHESLVFHHRCQHKDAIATLRLKLSSLSCLLTSILFITISSNVVSPFYLVFKVPRLILIIPTKARRSRLVFIHWNYPPGWLSYSDRPVPCSENRFRAPAHARFYLL